MDPSESGSALAALGEDLFVLSIRPRDGKLLTRGRIDSALMASELVRLAAAGRAWIAKGRIVARDRNATGDAELDAALLSLAGGAYPPRPETWIGLPRPGIRDAYATRLISAGVLRREPSRVLGASRYQVADGSRVAAARSRLDAVTQSSGPPASYAEAALAGLASAVGLAGVLYPGRDGQAPRARMAELARRQVAAHAAAGLGGGGDRLPLAGQVADPHAEEVLLATVHAVTAVIDSGAAVGSGAVGTQFLGIHRPGGPGEAHQASQHGQGDHGDGGHSGTGDAGHH